MLSTIIEITSTHNNSQYLAWSNFLSTPSIIDVFTFISTDGSFSLPTIYKILEEATFEITLAMDTLSHAINVQASLNVNIFTQFSTDAINTAENSGLSKVYASIAEDIFRVSMLQPDMNTLLGLFPQFRDEIAMLGTIVEEDDNDIYQTLSAPTVKLYYPEPFIASPSFVHEDVWYIHILHYQHWLWFMFISLIMFYFITFINVVRWCNMRTRPRRETRGVSRSKCADFITATVPVAWAASIIISESVDAADYYDGFGTGEMIVGIRAYQWGWEYFYPKGIDLNYNVTPSYAAVVGNSLKYSTTNNTRLGSNTLWKHYKLKKSAQTTTTPSHVILNFTDNAKVLNFTNLADVGVNTSKDAAAFKKIQYFSKTNPQNLSTNTSEFQSRYSRMCDLYLDDVVFTNTVSYGTLRQHNTAATAATTNNWNSVLDPLALDRLLSYNTGVTGTGKSKVASAYKLDLTTGSGTALGALGYANQNFLNTLLNAKTDDKYPSNALKALLSPRLPKQNLIGQVWNSDMVNLDSLPSSKPFFGFSEQISNINKLYTFKDLKSSNMRFLTSEKNLRSAGLLGSTSVPYNFLQAGSFGSAAVELMHHTNTPEQIQTVGKLELTPKPAAVETRLLSLGTSLDPVHPPVMSSNPAIYPLGFSILGSGDTKVSSMLKSNEDVSPTYLFNAYWLGRWGHTSSQHRYLNLDYRSDKATYNYFPNITNYADYDFRNWFALELLEDAYWESSLPSSAQDDYLNALEVAEVEPLFEKRGNTFNLNDRRILSENFSAGSVMPLEDELQNSEGGLPNYTEDGIPSTDLLSLKNFEPFNSELVLDSAEDSYENSKYLGYNLANIGVNLSSISTSTDLPLSYTYVLDSFRPDFEEKVMHTDRTLSNYNNADIPTETLQGVYSRLSNPIRLRSSAKNAIVTYNSLQKVFRSRFDEGRSNARLQDFSNSTKQHPFLTAPKVGYEKLLGKNKNTFFEGVEYLNTLCPTLSDIHQAWNTLNTYFSDLPFLVSLRSDASRYLWFDWQSRWSSIEHQPSSTARYSLSGVPYATKNYEYETAIGDTISDSENYITRLARARKNYLNNWAYTPYLYSKTAAWYNYGGTASNMFGQNNSLNKLKYLFSYITKSWSTDEGIVGTSELSTPSQSGVNSYNKSSWRPQVGFQAYYYNTSVMVDILTKREFMYRQYLLRQGLSTNLPNYFKASPCNPLLTEIKNAYPLVNPATYAHETSRECLYQNSNYLKLLLIKDFIGLLNHKLGNTALNLNSISNYLFFYTTSSESRTLVQTSGSYKNQYRPMRKGVMNMIRLHATGAVAMPIEIRMHILASSRDVIHSWAVPSAGIKIDCVPGYSSHRVTIFLVSGIFWGQCMEICGRFHHWMPIVVYFMKRDLFFLWCTHFMHYSHPDKIFSMSDRQLMEHIRLVSFDKTSWVSEINSIL